MTASSLLRTLLRTDARPIGLRLRSHYWFATFVIGLGITIDMLVYSIVIPVFPFRLESLGYTGVSGLVGWLLTSFSVGLVVSTIPIAILSEKYETRAWPLNIGMLLLIGSQIMLMFAPVYWVMCVARVLQGIASSTVWIVGLALVCDLTPKRIIGRQLGFALAGFSLGLLIGPTIGGVLYERFGYNGPLLFGIIGSSIDLIFRLFIIERKEALKWGIDPASEKNLPPADTEEKAADPLAPADTLVHAAVQNTDNTPKQELPFLKVVIKLCQSIRALAAFFLTLHQAFVFTSMEPAIPLHTNAVWGLNPTQVGLLFLALSLPTLIANPLSGYLCDTRGSEWVVAFGLTLAIPWQVVLSVEGPLALFIVSLAVSSFFVASSMTPLMSELATVSRSIEGVGYAHVYGAFNFIYGIGSALGPIIGGQIYDNVDRGFLAIMLFCVGITVTAVAQAFFLIGERPLARRLKDRLKGRKGETTTTANVDTPPETAASPVH